MGYKKKEIEIKEIYFKLRERQLFTCFLYGFFILISFQFLACNDSVSNEFITEGEIDYKIEYLESKEKNPLIAFLPEEMTTSFKYNASRTSIEGLFGTFKLIYIYNYPKKRNYTLLQILDKKYVYKPDFDLDEMSFGYNQMKNVKIIYSDSEKTIAGYRCKHASAVFEDGLKDTVDLYYTNEIGLMHANYNNPFKEIEGVLMEFSVNLVDIDMKFTAEKVRRKRIKEEVFELPKGFVNISEGQMKKIINDYNKSAGQ